MLQFANNLKAHLAEAVLMKRLCRRQPQGPRRRARRRRKFLLGTRGCAPPRPQKPISGFALIAKVLWRRFEGYLLSGAVVALRRMGRGKNAFFLYAFCRNPSPSREALMGFAKKRVKNAHFLLYPSGIPHNSGSRRRSTLPS